MSYRHKLLLGSVALLALGGQSCHLVFPYTGRTGDLSDGHRPLDGVLEARTVDRPQGTFPDIRLDTAVVRDLAPLLPDAMVLQPPIFLVPEKVTWVIPPPEQMDGPHLSDDGLRLYFGMVAPPNMRDIFVASRATLQDPFGQITPVVASAQDESDPALSADELVIVFERAEPDGKQDDLYIANRSDRYQPFSAPVPLAELNQSGSIEGGPALTPDGLRLYFETTTTKWGIHTALRPSRTAPFGPPNLIDTGVPSDVDAYPAANLLFFSGDPDPNQELYVMQLPPAAPDVRRLVELSSLANDGDPCYNPHLGILVFNSRRDGTSELFWAKVKP